MRNRKFECPVCHSESIDFSGAIEWDNVARDFVVVAVYDKGHECAECSYEGHYCNFFEKEYLFDVTNLQPGDVLVDMNDGPRAVLFAIADKCLRYLADIRLDGDNSEYLKLLNLLAEADDLEEKYAVNYLIDEWVQTLNITLDNCNLLPRGHHFEITDNEVIELVRIPATRNKLETNDDT